MFCKQAVSNNSLHINVVTLLNTDHSKQAMKCKEENVKHILHGCSKIIYAIEHEAL